MLSGAPENLREMSMVKSVHPFYESNRGAMESVMRHRLDLAEAMLRDRALLSEIKSFKQEVMSEFDIVLTQLLDVGGTATFFKGPSCEFLDRGARTARGAGRHFV
ncbi:MAG: hypothetical protein EOO27_03010 [Comamonadaceae bacterium]|nr:MAG: hypothetical protein EOO27_03010 [Comamonadaceae bacterium]